MKIRFVIKVALLVAFTAADPVAGNDMTVGGEIHSENGFRFPDGTLQLSAVDSSGYANTIIVAMSGGDFTGIQAAIDSIVDASLSKRYLIWVAPGYYYGKVTLKPYVDLKGAGRKATNILGGSGGTTLQMGDHSEVSSLRISCSAKLEKGQNCTGIQVDNADSGSSIKNAEIEAITQPSADTGGSAVGILVVASIGSSNLLVQNVEVSAAAQYGRTAAIRSASSTQVEIFDSRIEARSGEDNTALLIERGTIHLRDSNVRAYSTNNASSSLAADVQSGVATFRNSVFFSSGNRCFGLQVSDDSNVSMEYSEIITYEGNGSCAGAAQGILAQGDGSAMNIDVAHSMIRAGEYTVFNPLNPSNVVLRFTQFDGGPALGNNTCLLATDENLNPSLSTNDCP